MTDPTYTIRIPMTEVFLDGAFVPARDVRNVCETFGIKMTIVEERFFDFETDDIKKLFLLGLNFPRA